jgi:signal transduction histidine kinase
MNAVIGLAGLALRTELTPKQRDYVEKIHGSGTALLGILTDILDFSKIEADRVDLEHVGFDLPELLDKVLTLVEISAQSKGLRLDVVIAPDVPGRLVGDPLRLGQVLTNLASNAVKFTAAGEVELSVTIDPWAPKDGRVQLSFEVRDTGIGMTPAQVARLFQPFSQADDSTTRRFGGTGLGLTISRRLTEMMGGTLRVESSPGRGSRFIATLQLARDTEDPRGLLDAAGHARKPRVLVVDAQPGSQPAWLGVLQGLAEHVDVRSDANERGGRVDGA